MTRFGRFMSAFACVLLSGCTNVPWGEGGTSFGTPLPNALVRILGPSQIQSATQALTAHFSTLSLTNAALSFAIPNVGQASFKALPTSLSLEKGIITVQFQFEGSVTHTQPMMLPDPNGTLQACEASDLIPPSTIALRFTLEADHLGRIVAVPTEAPWGLTQWNGIQRQVTCEGQDPFVSPSRLESTILDEFLLRLSPVVRSTLPSALGLDLALSWTQTITNDPLGAGIARVSLHPSHPLLSWDESGIHQVSFQLGTEVEAHPCVAHLGPPVGLLPTPAPTNELDGTALSVSGIVELMHVLWRSGGLCGRSPLTNGSRLELPLTDMRTRWPELDRWAAQIPDATLSLELWPEAFPFITPVPATLAPLSDNSFIVNTYGFQIDLIGTLGGARWRLASVLVSFDLEGELILSPEGALTFELLEALPRLVAAESGLTFPPSEALLEGILTPFINALLHGIPLAYLPPALWPSETRVGQLNGDYVIFTGKRTVAGAEVE